MFDIRLDAPQQAQYNAIIAANGGIANLGNLYEGLSASFGCQTPAIGCGPSTSGAESFLAFAVPSPVVGAGIPGLVSAAFGLFGFNWYRRRRNGMLAA